VLLAVGIEWQTLKTYSKGRPTITDPQRPTGRNQSQMAHWTLAVARDFLAVLPFLRPSRKLRLAHELLPINHNSYSVGQRFVRGFEV